MSNNPGIIEQTWGYELVWASNELYCSKLLVFNVANAQTRLIFHKQKDKSWFVNVGSFKLTYIDITNGKTFQKVLNEGEVFNIPPSLPHQIELIGNNGSISEVGTADIDDDTFYLT